MVRPRRRHPPVHAARARAVQRRRVGPARRLPGTGGVPVGRGPPRGDRRRPARRVRQPGAADRRLAAVVHGRPVPRRAGAGQPRRHRDLADQGALRLPRGVRRPGVPRHPGRLRGRRHRGAAHRARRAPGRPDRGPVRPRDRVAAVRSRRLGGHAPARRSGARGAAREQLDRRARLRDARTLPGRPRAARPPDGWRDGRPPGRPVRADARRLQPPPRPGRRGGGARRARAGRSPAPPPPARHANRRALPADPDDPGRHQRHVHAGPGARPHGDRAAAPVVS